jgi:CDGSH-type Zn-finger protein/uncharacterized Fe-S cluster protein YjdI
MQTAKHPPSREQLLYWLHEASEIEHHLMCCYLYAAFSLKQNDVRWREDQRAAVQRWRQSLMSVVREEMSHLALVGNLANALGAMPHLNRPPFPIDAGPYPAGFVIRLAPFCAATVEHFKFLERPATEALADAAGFTPQGEYRRVVPDGRLSPGPRDYATVGELYEVLASSLTACVAASGEAEVFIGDPALQLDVSLSPLPGLLAVTNLATALQAINTIVTQGEGAGAEHADSHFSRFCRMGEELAAMQAADPTFAPAWPAATNPVMNRPVHSANERVHISQPGVARWLDIGNAIYTTSLRCLLQGFGAKQRHAKATWLTASFALMRALMPVGQGLAARPATEDPNGPHAGLTFTPLRTLAWLPEDRAALLLAERLGQLRERALALPLNLVAGETASPWLAVIELLAAQQAALLTLAGVSVNKVITAPQMALSGTAAQAVAQAAQVPVEQAQDKARVEIAEGKALTLLFEARRCIHSRHCVLDAPSVFKANTPGAWIDPDAISTEALVGVALSCPSGAIRMQRRDGGAEESAPPVNQLRIRENGPYALHAPLQIAGVEDGFRATLCRCGQSNNKPWCDGSHVASGFIASGEPPSGAVEALNERGGALAVTPMRNGPLQVLGNLEICAGTGRTVARTTEAKLCRCGASKSKPFCDLSHLAGFVADGAV